MKAIVCLIALIGLGSWLAAETPTGQAPTPVRVAAIANDPSLAAPAQSDLQAWHRVVSEWIASGRLTMTQRRADPFVAGRTFERFDEIYRGVPVFGGGLARQIDEAGAPVSIFGTVHPDIDIEISPTIGGPEADTLLGAGGGGSRVVDDGLTLQVLPTTAGYRLTWTARVASLADGHVHRLFLDASTGSVVFEYDDTWTQVQTDGSAGSGTGVIGDRLKLSVERVSTGYRTVDRLRRNAMTTYDMHGDPNRTRAISNGQTAVASSDIATDVDNIWTDTAVSSTHAYGGLSLDYLREVHGLFGIDGLNTQVSLFVNLARPEDSAALSGQFPLYFNNAFYTNRRAFFGVGNMSSFRNFAAGIDVVAHELAHGVTRFSSDLVYLNEPGALNEAFSDIIGAATEFYVQPTGTNLGQAEWLVGEDIPTNGGAIRSMSDPMAFGHPDHYSIRYTGTADNGGVHRNSGIVNNMFYLAVVGGAHRLSGLVVQGVGLENRRQIERVVVRAFTGMLTRNSVMADARAAMIQSARDLYGANSRAETAVTQAWTAVGVN